MLAHAGTAELETLYAAGHLLLTSDRIEDAAEAFRALVVLRERDERGWLGLADCHRLRGQQRLALELLRIGGAVTGGTARILIACARLETELGDHLRAERTLEAARLRSEGDDELESLLKRERSYDDERHYDAARATG